MPMAFAGLISEAPSGVCRTVPDCRMAAMPIRPTLHDADGSVGLISEAPSGVCRTVPDCRMAAMPYPAYLA